MKSQVSPAVAGVIIVVLIAVAGLAIWKFTGTGGHKEMSPEVRAHLLGSGGVPGAPSGQSAPAPGAAGR